MKAPVSLFLFFAVSFCFQPAMAEQLPFTIATGTGVLCGPVVIAQEKDFFKEQGLNTITISLRTEKLAFQAYEKGGADAAVHSSIHIVQSNFDASQHVIIGTIAYSDNQMKLVARKSAGITKILDLKGKKNIPGAIESGIAHATIQHGISIAETKKPLGEDYVIFQNPTFIERPINCWCAGHG